MSGRYFYKQRGTTMSNDYSRKKVSKALVDQLVLMQSSIPENRKDFVSRQFWLNDLLFDQASRGPLPKQWRVGRRWANIKDGEFDWLTIKDSYRVNKIWKKWKYEKKHAETTARRKENLTLAGYKNV